jgi:hypothetical protein
MRALVLVGVACAALAGCSASVSPPDEPRACFHVVQENGEVRFNRLASDVESIEFCAARLEEMRVNFLRLGGSVREITGAYQGQFIFIDRAGVSFGQKLDGGRFFAMARTGDGRLAIPGVIQRSAQENRPDR